MSDDVALPLEFTDAAANKVKSLIAEITRVYHRWRLQRLPVWFHL